jgi:hypothetical protein
MADVAIRVATLAMMFPHAAQKTKRLMASAISMRNVRDGGGGRTLAEELEGQEGTDDEEGAQDRQDRGNALRNLNGTDLTRAESILQRHARQ